MILNGTMIGIRHKLFLGFGGLLLIVAAMGLLTMRQIDSLGGAIDVILKQNYRSVIACQEMTESIDHIDSGVLFTFAGHYDEGMSNIRHHEQDFRNALQCRTWQYYPAGRTSESHTDQGTVHGVYHQVIDSGYRSFSITSGEAETIFFRSSSTVSPHQAPFRRDS